MILKTEAIVLKSLDFRETSQIVTFFTRDYGKVRGVLKGIRKDPKKFGSSVDRFSINEIVYYRYRNSDLHLISQCDLRQYFFKIREDFKKSMAASYISELVSIIMPLEERNLQVYQLMFDFLRSLEMVVDISQLVYFFQIRILLYSGFKPHLDTCLRCDKRIEGKARFSLKDGGLICMNCPIVDTIVHFVSLGAVASILHIEKNEWRNCLKLRLTEGTKNELKYVLNNFLVFHLGRQIKSAKFVNEVDN